MTPTTAPLRWQVDRIARVREPRQPYRIGVSGLGDLHHGLAADDGTLRSSRMLPVPIWPPDTERASLTCWDCGLRKTATLTELRARANRAERRGRTVVVFP
jgi:hypothetical protein